MTEQMRKFNNLRFTTPPFWWPQGDSAPSQPYLNSGVLMARAWALREIFARHAWPERVDDQTWWGDVWKAEPELVLVDSARKLFACPSLSIDAGEASFALASTQSGPRPKPELWVH